MYIKLKIEYIQYYKFSNSENIDKLHLHASPFKSNFVNISDYVKKLNRKYINYDNLLALITIIFHIQ